MDLPKKIAHRGASAYAPENTLAAFALAEQQGAHMFECDVQLSHDDVPIILHDESLLRTTGIDLKAHDLSFAQISTLDARIPSLEALLAWFRPRSLLMNLELKCPPEIPTQMLALLPPAVQARIMISSFDLPALRIVRKLLPNITVSLLIDEANLADFGWEKLSTFYKEINAFSLNVDKTLLTPEQLARFQTISPHLLAFTVNDPEEATALYEKGLCAVFADDGFP